MAKEPNPWATGETRTTTGTATFSCLPVVEPSPQTDLQTRVQVDFDVFIKGDISKVLDSAYGGIQNLWIESRLWRLYVRHTERLQCIDGYVVRVEAFDIGSISVQEGQPQGTGAFRVLLPLIEQHVAAAGIPVVLIENVLDLRFKRFFEGQGYALYTFESGGMDTSSGPWSMIKRVRN